MTLAELAALLADQVPRLDAHVRDAPIEAVAGFIAAPAEVALGRWLDQQPRRCVIFFCPEASPEEQQRPLTFHYRLLDSCDRLIAMPTPDGGY